MPTMIQKAALHLYQIDMGCNGGMRSYDYAEAVKLRTELLAAGFTETQVDCNGKLDTADYFDQDDEADKIASAKIDAAAAADLGQLAQLGNSPETLTTAVTAYLDEDPEGVLMVAQDGLDALVLEVHGEADRVLWFTPDGEVKVSRTPWTVLTPAPAEA